MSRLPHDGVQERKDGDARRTVAIIPGSARLRYGELLRALEEAYPVSFAGSSRSEIDAADAVIALACERPYGLRVPCLALEGPGPERERGSPFTVELSRSAGLDRALHSQRLLERHARPPAPLPNGAGTRVLATVAGKPVWVQSDADGVHHETASALPVELEDHEFLRDHLTAGRFWSLLPIVHFLKKLSCGVWTQSHIRPACFIIDDPNVRFSSYGYLSFPELARDARECNYHVAVATIPLDLVAPGRGAVGVFRSFRPELSLVVHGNDHVHRELERCRNAGGAERVLASALARVGRFERRTGIRIDRVMCPPHGGCSPEMLAALFTCGFLGLAASRPFPWDGFADQRRWRLGGWLPAQLAGGGLPVIPRYSISRNLDDLVFRAFLGQPLILYLHHADLRDGLEPLRAAARRIQDLGEARWMSLASITRRNAVCREHDGVATVTLYARDVRLPRPAAPRARLEVPRVFGASELLRFVVDGESHDVCVDAHGRASVTLADLPPGDELRIQISGPGHMAAAAAWDWRPRAWPVARRVMTEARDRALPVVRGSRN